MTDDRPTETAGCDADALFDHLYHAHVAGVYAYLAGRSGDPDIARDLVQETFLRVWRQRHLLAGFPPARQQAWIFTAARNLLTDYYRTRATRSAVQDKLSQRPAPRGSDGVSCEEQAEAGEMLHQLGTLIQGLPEDLRTVLLMQVLGHMSSGQIGTALGRPAGSIRYQIGLARKHLAADLRLAEQRQAQKETIS